MCIAHINSHWLMLWSGEIVSIFQWRFFEGFPLVWTMDDAHRESRTRRQVRGDLDKRDQQNELQQL